MRRGDRVGKLNKYYMQMTVLVAETRENLQHIVSEFESMGLKINVGKSKVLTTKKDQMGRKCKMSTSLITWEK